MKGHIRKSLKLWIAVLLVMTVGFGLKCGIGTRAASSNIWVELNNQKVEDEILMETRSVNLTMASSGTSYLGDSYIIQWVIAKDDDKEIIEFQATDESKKYNVQGEGIFNAVVKAKKPGLAQVDLYVYDKTQTDGTTSVGLPVAEHITCNIRVVFSIDTELDSAYKYVYPSDAKRSLVMYVDDQKEMNLNIGDAADQVLWQSGNKDVIDTSVVTETDASGKVTKKVMAKAKGAGVTTLTADGRYGNDEIKVYVVPKISMNGSNFDKTGTYSMKSGDWLYTDAIFSDNKTLTIKDKMVWVISKYDNSNNKVIIEDSLGNKKSDLIELTSVGVETQQNLKVAAKAGQYVIDFYPVGAYKNEKEKSETVPATTIVLNVYADFSSKEVTLNIGDQFNIADSLNITTEEYIAWFETTFIPEGYANSIYYNASKGIITANAVHGETPIVASINVKKGYEEKVRLLLNNKDITGETLGPFKITLRIIDGLVLDQTNVRMVVGDTLQLIPTTTTYDGTYEWSSSDEKLVKVSEEGLLTAMAATTEDVTITVSQKLSNGSIKKATCKVRVIETVKDISLNTTELKLELGDSSTVVASFNPDRSNAPLQWISSDNDIFSITISSDKKSAIITAKSPGSAVLTVLNEDNFSTVTCKVTVLSSIKTITLNEAQMSVKLNREVIRLNAAYTPANATNNELDWQSSDTSVATVDKSGLVTLLKAGTTVITVKPVYNTSPPVMAQCILTVVQSTTGLTLDQTSMTLEAGETQLLSYLLEPVNATTKVTFTSLDTKVAVISDKGVITAKAAGKTYMVATAEDGYSATCEVVVTQAATGIKLDVTTLTLGVGDSYAVSATISPADSTEKKLSWTSQDTKIATVTADGTVKGVSAGSTIILVKTKAGEIVYLYVNVYDIVKSLTINPASKTIGVNQSFTIATEFTPKEASNQNVTWVSSNEKVATVSAAGKVKGLQGGTTVISCTSEDGGYIATCLVTVEERVTEVTLNHESYKLFANESVTLKASVNAVTANNKNVKWTTSNKKIATVNKKGKVTAKKVGKCTIKVQATDGSKEYATCTIRVLKPVTSLKISKSYIKLYEGKSKKIASEIKPKSASVKGVKWTSSNIEVAIVDGKGRVTAIKEGSAKIKATTTDGTKKSATCIVDVVKVVPTTAITVSQKDITMIRGTSQSIAISIQPTNTTDKITYVSDSKSVATVNSKGKVTAKRPGNASITITSSSGKQAVVNITVVGLNKTSIVLEQYDSDELWVEETNTGVKWSSSNPSVVRVTNGSVVARKVGTATITATINGVRLTCRVTVKRISK